MTYIEQLTRSARDAGSLFCLGIDPVLERFPRELAGHGSLGEGGEAIRSVVPLLEVALDALDDAGVRPAAFKPNLGYFSRHDRPLERRFTGSIALAAVLELLRRRMPNVPVILDAKRGDIARSSANYAVEAFEVWGADAVTVSPWMGDDSVEPFLSRAAEHGRGVYILARTSNPGAARFQNLLTGGEPIYRRVIKAVMEWNDRAKSGAPAGVVLGATAPAELRDALTLLRGSPAPVLVPGVGGQGGSAAEVLSIVRETDYPPDLVRVNASSGALFPWARSPGGEGRDWRDAIRDAVFDLHRSLQIVEVG